MNLTNIVKKMVSPILSDLFLRTTHTSPERVVALTPAGSNRRYYRLSSSAATLVGCEGTSLDENEAFFAVGRQLRAAGARVPEIIAVSDDRLCYLQQDLGDTSLFSLLQQGNDSLCDEVMRQLPLMQHALHGSFDFSRCYPLPAMDRRSVMWDLNYFKYDFLKFTSIDFSEPLLEDAFEQLADALLAEEPTTFMYRDFQSRNVLVHDGQPWFIDFQGGRRGPIEYDVASFLWQVRANFSEAQRERLIGIYLDALKAYRPVDEEHFRQRLRLFVLFRLMQVLGAYGFRGLYEKKAHFLQSLVPAVRSLRHELDGGCADAFPYLREILYKVCDLPRFAPSAPAEGLTVQVTSFSYRRALPEDLSGNGGGFVFDCRAIHNPGRYDEYKALTGRDEAVVRFLDDVPAMADFLTHVYALVDDAVDVYLRRGFSHLCVSFGCTGGQHRSVYAAEHLAAHLQERYGSDVHVALTHREHP